MAVCEERADGGQVGGGELVAARHIRLGVGDEEAVVCTREDGESVLRVWRKVFGECAQAGVDGDDIVGAAEQGQHWAAHLR